MPIKKIQSRRFNLTLDWNILRVVGIYMCIYIYIYIDKQNFKIKSITNDCF